MKIKGIGMALVCVGSALACALALGTPGLLAPAHSATKRLSSFDTQAQDLISKMSLEEKIGQMTQPEQSGLKDIRDIETYYLGSLLSGGGSDPKEGNGLQAWTDMIDRYQT